MSAKNSCTDTTPEPEDDFFEDDDGGCWYCDGDGMDPLCDYAVPCPFCWEGP